MGAHAAVGSEVIRAGRMVGETLATDSSGATAAAAAAKAAAVLSASCMVVSSSTSTSALSLGMGAGNGTDIVVTRINGMALDCMTVWRCDSRTIYPPALNSSKRLESRRHP